jgi:RHS repeat-associated protein
MSLSCFSSALAVACFLSFPASAAETVTYFHLDALGSPVVATNQAGNVIWREEYQPYGERIQNQPQAQTNTRWYTGHPHDQATGLTYMGARWYDPVVGRFMGVDPVGFGEGNPHSFNRYNYANNNPYKYVDPDGAFPIVPIVVWVATTGWSVYEMMKPVQLDVHGDAGLVTIPTLPGPIGSIGAGAKVGAKEGTEIVQRAMSRGELKSIEESGALSRGGRDGPFHVSDAVNSNAQRARQRLSLGETPEIRATLEVPKGVFSSPSKVSPKYGMPGGGMERTAPGDINIPAKIRGVDEF